MIMRLPKGVKLIEVDDIKLVDRDEFKLSSEKDFISVCKSIGFKAVFRKRYETSVDYSDYYYLVGTDVIYIYHEQVSKKSSGRSR